MSVLLEAALAYSARGMPIFPCQPKGKAPASARGLLDATSDFSRVKAWWQSFPQLNIGLATGKPSGIFVVDVDGEAGRSSMTELENKHGKLPQTYSVITGRDGSGEHVYFKLGHRTVRNSAGVIAPGIDVRGDGGYVLAPPSVHPSGRVYQLSVDGADSFAEPPQWLLDLIEANHNTVQGKPLEHWHKTLTEQVPEGQRNATLASLCGKLLHCGLTDITLLFDMMLCVNAARCNPPLPPHEVETIVSSVVRSHLRKIRANA